MAMLLAEGQRSDMALSAGRMERNMSTSAKLQPATTERVGEKGSAVTWKTRMRRSIL